MKVFRQSIQFDVPKGEELDKDQDAGLSPWVNPGDMSEGARSELVKKIEAGEVFSLRFRARTFGDGPNLNRTRLSRQQVKQLASTSKGVNLLNGHGGCFDGSEASLIVGEVLGGKTDKTTEGETVLVLDHRLADKAAMIQFARGLWRSFSISIGADGWEERGYNGEGKEVGRDSPEAVRFENQAMGNVMLMHNAFVAEPAYRNTATIQPHSIGGAKENDMSGVNKALPAPAAPPDESGTVAKLQADLAASEAKVKQLSDELAAEKKAYFDTMWDYMVGAGKVLPEEKEMFSAWAEKGGNAGVKRTFCAKLGNKHTTVPMSAFGEAPNATPPAAPPSANPSEPKHFGGSPEAEQGFIKRARRPKAQPKK